MRKMTGMAYVYQWYATVNLETIRFTASSLLRCCKIWNQERIRMINNLMYIELKTGLKYREGGCTVGSGRVATIIE